MACRSYFAGTLLLFAGIAFAQTAPQWGQCGGIGWPGPTTCPSAGGDGGGSTSTTTGGGGGGTSTTTATGGTATLAPGNSWIRAVVDPNFHKYLRSETLGTASEAVLGEPSEAAQFQVTGGQLVQMASSGKLYAIVEDLTDPTVKKLKVTWSTSPATAGTFDFSGDTLEWSNPAITRPQNNAWLVCPDSAGNRDLYVNLGAYAYQTPAGCADQTIHAYTGSTASA
ncbi:hypothetical protein E1B28_006470 [Marasmius oreades]|uniref:CBM1 domain-containing protein n=1 Tax=Marasmius oreades TaxID=181124 RepID=A0A9P7UVS7_9AGAR|nr:uncharacterized protein E1B28_006470 [Marasmius oreades]KAG7095765.1 hypothetical protein E1B28_006470 [Marasmius oreades]